MSRFERIFLIRPLSDGWAVSEGERDVAKSKSQSGAIKCAALAAMSAQAQGYVATFRMAI